LAILFYLTIETTEEHPFLKTTGEWTSAGSLKVGDVIFSNGYIGTVEQIVFVSTPQLMYNLTVDEAHTYFVGEGQWLVHNQCPFDADTLYLTTKVPDRNGFTRAGRSLQKHSNRAGSPWQSYKPSRLNPTNYSAQTDELVMDILTDPASTSRAVNTRYFGHDFFAPDGRGLRFNTSGDFIGFLDGP